MARKKGLKQYSEEELVKELAHRHASQYFREGMTLSEIELSVDAMIHKQGEPSIALMLSRMKPEKPTAKACPKCGKRTPVKARDRERSVRSLAGPLTFKRNYHYCEACKFGFYPVDRRLDLPEEGELTAEMEKRVLDFAINDVYGQCAARWTLHYGKSISDNQLRQVVNRVGRQCEQADELRLQEQLKPIEKPTEVLVVQNDGGMLPMRGPEPWKEAKVGVIYRHDVEKKKPQPESARYVAVIDTMEKFTALLREALAAERSDEVQTIVWLGDGALCNWTLVDLLAPDAVQILDYQHAVQHAVDCGKVLLGEGDPCLAAWQQRAEALLMEGDTEATVQELMQCVPEVKKRRKGRADGLKALDGLVRYFRNNAHRMRYRLFREHGYPIGTGAVESAHRHVLQSRMKRSGQHWAMASGRRMARLRAAYRTAGALQFHAAIRRAHWATRTEPPRLRRGRNHRDLSARAARVASD